jgi:type II secretory pathway pseudopilin PulG
MIPARRAGRGGGAPDAGETLIELIVTVAVMAVAIVTILASFFTATVATTTNRQITQANTLLTNYADQLAQSGCDPALLSSPCLLHTGNGDTPNESPNFYYRPCAQTSLVGDPNDLTTHYPKFTNPLDTRITFKLEIIDVKYWNRQSYNADGSPAYVTANSCNPATYAAGLGPDFGVQQITLRARGGGPKPIVETLVVVKRDANGDAN